MAYIRRFTETEGFNRELERMVSSAKVDEDLAKLGNILLAFEEGKDYYTGLVVLRKFSKSSGLKPGCEDLHLKTFRYWLLTSTKELIIADGCDQGELFSRPYEKTNAGMAEKMIAHNLDLLFKDLVFLYGDGVKRSSQFREVVGRTTKEFDRFTRDYIHSCSDIFEEYFK